MSLMDHLALEIEVPPSGLPNLVQNPSGELGSWGYVTPTTNTTLSAVPVGSGSDYWLEFGTALTQAAFFQTEHLPVAAGEWASASFDLINSSTASESYRLSFAWYNASKVQIGTSVASASVSTTGRTWFTDIQAPAGTVYARLNVGAYTSGGNLGAGRWIRFDDLMVTKTATHSVALPGFAFTEPVEWENILGPTSRISITRAALDTGTLVAEILDADLDPAIADTIRQGKRVRLVGETTAGAWEPIFTGRVSTAKTDYRKAKGGSLTDKGAVRISLTATDNISHLASQGERRGVATVAHLAYLLEGKGVPWSVNGVGNQLAGSPTVVSTNSDASVLDQVAITRDTVLGYAWVDGRNVLNVRDSATMPTTAVATFSDVPGSPLSYTDITADFDLSDITNVVSVNWLRWNATSDQTEVIPYGPYRSETSIATYGAYGRTFTIHGASESSASIVAYAASILAANATPVVTCRSLTLLADDDISRDAAIGIDLYSPVAVEYADRIDTTTRVTGLTHTITPERWTVAYILSPGGTVAAPQVTPTPPTNPNIVPTRAGVGAGTTNGSGAIVVTHGMGAQPTGVVVSGRNAAWEAILTGLTPTTFTVTFRDRSTNAVAGNGIAGMVFDWYAFVA